MVEGEEPSRREAGRAEGWSSSECSVGCTEAGLHLQDRKARRAKLLGWCLREDACDRLERKEIGGRGITGFFQQEQGGGMRGKILEGFRR